MRRRNSGSVTTIMAAVAAGLVGSALAYADPIPGNFWPNPTLETPSATQVDAPAGWRRGGGDFGDPTSNPPFNFDFWDNAQGAVSGTKALRVTDNSTTGNGEWFVPDFGADPGIVPLPATGGDFLRISYRQNYNTVGDMRVTIRGHDGVGGFGLGPLYDFVVNGSTGGQFVNADFTVPIPAAVNLPGGLPMTGMQINIASGGGAEVTGFIAVDDIYVARVPEPASALALLGMGALVRRRNRK